jgi:hypothetical protein
MALGGGKVDADCRQTGFERRVVEGMAGYLKNV